MLETSGAQAVDKLVQVDRPVSPVPPLPIPASATEPIAAFTVSPPSSLIVVDAAAALLAELTAGKLTKARYATHAREAGVSSATVSANLRVDVPVLKQKGSELDA